VSSSIIVTVINKVICDICIEIVNNAMLTYSL